MDRGAFIKELHINLMGLFTRRKTSVLLFHHSAVHHEVKIILALEAEMQMSPLGCAFRISEIPKKADMMLLSFGHISTLLKHSSLTRKHRVLVYRFMGWLPSDKSQHSQ